MHLSTNPPVPPVYPPHVDWHAPLEIMPVWEMFDRSAVRYADRPCIDFLDRRYSYAEIGNLVDRAAAGLQAIGLKKGDRVGLFLPNCPYTVIFLFAVLKAGGIAVNFNPLYADLEIKHQIEDSSARFMVTLDLVALYPKLASMLGRTNLERIIVCPMADCLPFLKRMLFPLLRRKEMAAIPADKHHVLFNDLISHGKEPARVSCDPVNDVALLQYTGGTTGTPKAAMLTHRNIVANAQQCLHWLPPARLGQERVMAILPFFHVFALTAAETLAVLGGFEIVLLPRFDLKQLLETVQKKKPSIFPGVPTMYTAINNFKDIGKYDLSSVKYCISGGAALPVEVKAKFERLTGCTLVEGYGLSETSPVATTNPYCGPNKPGSIGLPIPGTTIEILSLDEERRVLPQGEQGEIAIRGPQVMRGYWNRPDETAMVLENGRLRTGDVGYIDPDGYVFLVDRIKDIIIAGGYNIYPRNVEEAIYQHPDVAECVVCGIPDPYRGETVKAFIVKRDGSALTAGDLTRFLADKLSPIESPKAYEFRDTLPKTQVGKHSRKALRDEIVNASSAA